MGSGSSDLQGCQYSDPLEMNPSIMFLDGCKFWTPLQGRGWSKGYRLGLRLGLSLGLELKGPNIMWKDTAFSTS